MATADAPFPPLADASRVVQDGGTRIRAAAAVRCLWASQVIPSAFSRFRQAAHGSIRSDGKRQLIEFRNLRPTRLCWIAHRAYQNPDNQ
jgi:hypothetical protein